MSMRLVSLRTIVLLVLFCCCFFAVSEYLVRKGVFLRHWDSDLKQREILLQQSSKIGEERLRIALAKLEAEKKWIVDMEKEIKNLEEVHGIKVTPLEPENDVCQELKRTKTKIFIGIFSRPERFSRRQVIRSTWMRRTSSKMTIKFVIARQLIANELLKGINIEIDQFNDLLLLNASSNGELIKNLLTTIYQTYELEYFMKTTDQSYILLERLPEVLNELPNTRVYWGNFLVGSSVIPFALRSNKQIPHKVQIQNLETDSLPRVTWEKDVIDEEYMKLNERYAVYATGEGYILSADIIQWLTLSTVPLKTWENEDAQIGTWLSGLSVQRIHAGNRLLPKDCSTCHCHKREVFVFSAFQNDSNFVDCFDATSYMTLPLFRNDNCPSCDASRQSFLKTRRKDYLRADAPTAASLRRRRLPNYIFLLIGVILGVVIPFFAFIVFLSRNFCFR